MKTFDTSAVREAVNHAHYPAVETLPDLVVTACDEIDRLRTEVAELSMALRLLDEQRLRQFQLRLSAACCDEVEE